MHVYLYELTTCKKEGMEKKENMESPILVSQKELCEAATEGDVAKFKEVVKEDRFLLDVVSFACPRNPLHIAITHGRVGIVEEVLRINPQLARDLDSKNSSSLHIAAAQGNVEIVEKLLAVAPEMCWWRDSHDMNPIHIAAMKGHDDVLTKLLGHDTFPAMERVYRGQTVLHLCVKHRRLETLKVLAEKLGELVCAKDDDGETLLHLAVRSNQFEMIQYLVESNLLEKLTTNSMGKTAVDILNQSPQDATTHSNIKKILHNLSCQSILEALPELSDTTMVVVVLIATMAFQATVRPPGGVWQNDTSSHSAGEAVLASTHPKLYTHFSRANTTAFVSSLITIFLLTTKEPSEHFFFLAIATYAMWVSLASIGVSYGASLIMTNPMETLLIGHVVAIVVSSLLGIYTLVYLYHKAHERYLSWKRKERKQQDLQYASQTSRWFYHLCGKLFESPAIRSRERILRRLPKSGSPPPPKFGER